MMKTMQNNNDIRKRLDFSNDENKPKRQTTNIHMFLNQHQNKPKNFQSEPNMLNNRNNNTVTFTSQQDNNSMFNNNISSFNNTSPTKNQLPMPSTSEGNMSPPEQKYAGGGYSKSPNPKSLGKPGLQSPFKSNSPPKKEYILNHNSSVPIMTHLNTSPVHNNTSQSSNNVLRFDSETFFKSVNTSNNNLLNPPFFNIHSNMK